MGPGGPPVDDDMISAESLQEAYYYSSPGKRISTALGNQLIRHRRPTSTNQGINDSESDASSYAYSSHAAFAHDHVARDRMCVLIGAGGTICDATHLSPHSKGDAVRPFFAILTHF
jgi:hypothetical protein